MLPLTFRRAVQKFRVELIQIASGNTMICLKIPLQAKSLPTQADRREHCSSAVTVSPYWCPRCVRVCKDARSSTNHHHSTAVTIAACSVLEVPPASSHNTTSSSSHNNLKMARGSESHKVCVASVGVPQPEMAWGRSFFSSLLNLKSTRATVTFFSRRRAHSQK
jgi:hypothetical protein